MDVRTKYLRNNLLATFVIIDFVYVILFFVFYLVNSGLTMTIISVLDSISTQPALILLLLHPFVFVAILILYNKQNVKQSNQLTIDLETQNTKVEQVTMFIDQLREGQKTLYFNDEFQKDRLIRSLLNLRDELEKTRKEEEFRKEEEQQRHWTNEGLARFGAILQENVEDLEILAHEITSNLTKYMNIQQAGFFVVKETGENKVIEMISLFAFNRKKFPDKVFQWGEGLIGAAAIEQKTIYLEETTEAYLEITSGLGKSNPRAILIIPIKDSEGNVHGVLEVASFKKFEKFEIAFVEQVANSIGLTMATIQTSLRTQELLKESQKQAELLAQQEEIMRKNIDEIISQSQKYETELIKTQNELQNIDKVLYHFQLSAIGQIKYVNEYFANRYFFEDKSYLIDKDFLSLIPKTDSEWFVSFWQELLAKKENRTIELKLLDAQNKMHWINGFFYLEIDEKQQVQDIILIGVEFTEKDIHLQERQVLQSVSSFAFIADLTIDGKFTYMSDNFLKKLMIEHTQLEKMTVFDFIEPQELQQYETIWTNIVKGRKYRASRKFIDSEKNEHIFDLVFTPIYNVDNNIEKISLFAIDVTDVQDIKEKFENLRQNFEQSENKLTALTTNFENQIEKTSSEIRKQYEQEINELTILNTFVNNLNQTILLVQDDHYVVYNNLAEEIFGYRKEIVLGKKILYLFPEVQQYKEDSNYLRNNLNENFEDKEMFIIDKEQKLKQIKATVKHFSENNKKYTTILLKKI